jgi:nucleoredoxin
MATARRVEPRDRRFDWRTFCCETRMRISLHLMVLLLVSSLVEAKTVPLTAKEIGLMLRTGCSNEAVMHELSTRHFADTCDDATKKMLTQSGASPALINALNSGAYAVPPGQAARTQEQLAAESKRRADMAEESRKFDTLYQHQLAQQRMAAPVPTTTTSNALFPLLKGDLVYFKNGTVNRFDDEAFEKKKLIALYFSAHWCGPCRKFTPQLVEYYNRVAPQHPELEIVFVSADRSQFAFETYMKETQMPWPAIDFQKVGSKAQIHTFAGKGIPDLVLLDASGKVLSDSYAGTEYRGPQHVLADLDQILAGGGARVAQGQ